MSFEIKPIETKELTVKLRLKGGKAFETIFETILFYFNPENYPDKILQDGGKKAGECINTVVKLHEKSQLISVETK